MCPDVPTIALGMVDGVDGAPIVLLPKKDPPHWLAISVIAWVISWTSDSRKAKYFMSISNVGNLPIRE